MPFYLQFFNFLVCMDWGGPQCFYFSLYNPDRMHKMINWFWDCFVNDVFLPSSKHIKFCILYSNVPSVFFFLLVFEIVNILF